MNKKKVIFFILLFFLLIGIILLFYYSDKNNSTSNSSNSEAIDYKGIIPGTSSKEDVIEALGTPIIENKVEKYDQLEFKSDNPNYNNETLIEEDKVVFIKKIVVKNENIMAQEIKSKYGEPTNILYSHKSSIGINLYVYPEKGIAYIAHGASGILYEIWYFVPTTIGDFKQKWASNYSDELNLGPDEIRPL